MAILKVLKQFLPTLALLLNVFNLMVGLGFLALSGQYVLDMFGLMDAPDPRWIGWFVDDLFHMVMSAKSSQAVVWIILLIGVSLVLTSVHSLYRVIVKSTLAQERTAQYLEGQGD